MTLASLSGVRSALATAKKFLTKVFERFDSQQCWLWNISNQFEQEVTD
jgi:hypothetical protein